MTYNEFAENIKTLATSLKCRYAYHHFPLGTEPKLPWIVFDYPESRPIFADDKNFCERVGFTIELYTETKDFDIETAIGEALKGFGLTYRKYEDWVEDERFYRITFEGEVIINA